MSNKYLHAKISVHILKSLRKRQFGDRYFKWRIFSKFSRVILNSNTKKRAKCFLQLSSFGFLKMDKNKVAWRSLACENIFRKLAMSRGIKLLWPYFSARRPRDPTKIGWCSSPVIQGSATLNARCKSEVKHSCVYGEKLTYFVSNGWGWHFLH